MEYKNIGSCITNLFRNKKHDKASTPILRHTKFMYAEEFDYNIKARIMETGVYEKFHIIWCSKNSNLYKSENQQELLII